MLTQASLSFIAAALGAFLAAFLARRIETFKHLQESRATAYADFLRGFAKVGRAQRDKMRDERSHLEELEGRLIVTDSRSRIAVYGSRDVLRSLARFIRLGTQTLTPEGAQAFAEMCALMRQEATGDRALVDDIKAVLYD